jgi:hypothetical protein
MGTFLTSPQGDILTESRQKAYNQVNSRQGYGILTIVTPKEVVTDEKASDG